MSTHIQSPASNPLDAAALERYQRQIILPEIGGAGQVALSRAHVMVVGAGGMGCPVIQYLVGAGIGALTIVDHDKVALHNLPRQVLFGEADIGQPKAQAAASWCARLNSQGRFRAEVRRFGASMLAEARPDLIVDGTDSFAARLMIADAAHAAKVPLLSAAIGRFQGQVGLFRGWQEGQPCYRCFVGDAFDADDCDTCAELGVLGAMCGMVGSFAASEATRFLVSPEHYSSGMLHVMDGVAPSLRSIRIGKDPACRTCGSGTH
jgi:molybdopterin-synthase adenylyltransferase